MDEDRRWLFATYAALVLAGIALGVWAAFLVPLRLAGGVEGLSDVLAVVGPVGLGLLGAWGTGSLAGAALPSLAFFTTTLVAGMAGPGGDLVVPGGLEHDPGVGVVGNLLLLAGVAGTGLAIGIAARTLRRPPRA